MAVGGVKSRRQNEGVGITLSLLSFPGYGASKALCLPSPLRLLCLGWRIFLQRSSFPPSPPVAVAPPLLLPVQNTLSQVSIPIRRNSPLLRFSQSASLLSGKIDWSFFARYLGGGGTSVFCFRPLPRGFFLGSTTSSSTAESRRN